MELKERLDAGIKEAMRAKDAQRLSTLRLISAAIKDREIALRGEAGVDARLSEADLAGLLGRMIRQRQESARAFEEGGRLELAEREQAEIGYIQAFLPRQLDEAEVARAIDTAIAGTGASSLRDMGAVMAELRARHAGQMDFAAVGPMVKSRLMGGA
ncbi:GatB/YqeY domain-containing protein [Paracoccus sp. S-4012]|uniref:GatB/YqeY domain-containing protein n=1 Tax=Paracoccus sp. S-4012 TaxID=2665648 RepID=UPI0012AEF42E|nr:GatB/YqeY domain-containing protein [Paracoccus sp. S-4012]MRX49370.1 GatB/YqeY domain-containing protein [Paracoccus sp. S-4012]